MRFTAMDAVAAGTTWCRSGVHTRGRIPSACYRACTRRRSSSWWDRPMISTCRPRRPCGERRANVEPDPAPCPLNPPTGDHSHRHGAATGFDRRPRGRHARFQSLRAGARPHPFGVTSRTLGLWRGVITRPPARLASSGPQCQAPPRGLCRVQPAPPSVGRCTQWQRVLWFVAAVLKIAAIFAIIRNQVVWGAVLIGLWSAPAGSLDRPLRLPRCLVAPPMIVRRRPVTARQ